MAPDPLTQALTRLADGDRSAFDAVYDAAWPRVRALCLRMVAGPDGEDAAQQALVKVFERCGEYDPERGRAMPWILGIAAWEARTVLRARGRRGETGQVERHCPDPDPEAALIAIDLGDALDEVLRTMSPADREALYAAAGKHPRPDVAPATFRKRVQRALERLRAAWEETHG